VSDKSNRQQWINNGGLSARDRARDRVRAILKRPFYRDKVCVDDFIGRLKKVRDKNFYDIMEGIPEMWLQQIDPGQDSGELRMLVGDRLIEKINKVDILTGRMEILKELKFETEAERRSTAFKNRNAFKKKYGLC